MADSESSFVMSTAPAATHEELTANKWIYYQSLIWHTRTILLLDIRST